MPAAQAGLYDRRVHAGTTFRPYAPFLHDYVDTVLGDGPTLKEKAFAPGVNRGEVTGVEASIGLPLDEFIAVSIGGLQLVAPEIGL